MVDKKSRFISAMIALLPLTSFIRVPGISLGLGMVGLIVLIPWLFIINGSKIQLSLLAKFSGLILFCIYSIARSSGNTTNIIGFVLVMIWVIGTNIRWIDETQVFRIMKFVSIVASIIIVLQTICHYVLGFHLVSNITALLREETSQQYSSLIKTGIDNTGMYRPSAFFLEPSHFAQYGIVTLLWCLLRDESAKYMRNAVVISIGIALTTSGMGIVMVAGAWILYVIFGMDLKKKSNMAKAAFLVIAGLVVVILLSRLPIFQSAVNRITGKGGGYNAIWGRLFWWDYYFAPLSTSQLILGLGYAADTSKYMTGFMEILYCTGYVGVALFYFMLLQNAKNREKYSVALALFYGAMVVFSGLTTIINLVFFLTIIFVDEKKAIPEERHGVIV